VDLEEDKKRFYVSENGIVLVTPDMLGQKVHRIR
jgi:glucose-1-phosphate adenylyltransferase